MFWSVFLVGFNIPYFFAKFELTIFIKDVHWSWNHSSCSMFEPLEMYMCLMWVCRNRISIESASFRLHLFHGLFFFSLSPSPASWSVWNECVCAASTGFKSSGSMCSNLCELIGELIKCVGVFSIVSIW